MMPIKPRKLSCRLLHYILKIGDRPKNVKFFREVLGMKVLRHEEYIEEPSSSETRPYPVYWSKTFFGYGPEEKYFSVELVWNSEITSYEVGTAYEGITIVSRESIARAKALKWPVKMKKELQYVESPDGYKFFLIDEPQPEDKDPIANLTLNSGHIARTANYWLQLCGIGLIGYTHNEAVFSYGATQPIIVFLFLDEPIIHGTGKGKMVFSIPYRDLQDIETISRDTDRRIIAPLKQVEISENQRVNLLFLADSEGHEICFLDQESYKIISHYDPLGEAFLYYCLNHFEKECKIKCSNSSKNCEGSQQQ